MQAGIKDITKESKRKRKCPREKVSPRAKRVSIESKLAKRKRARQ